MDFLGNPAEWKAVNGWLTVAVSEEPLYIHDLNLNDVFISGKDFLSFKAVQKITKTHLSGDNSILNNEELVLPNE